MRSWRNRHTRTFEGRVGDRTGSSPVGRTIKKACNFVTSFFIVFALAAVLDDGSRPEQRTTGYAGEFKML